MALIREKYPTIRNRAAEWEYETFADYKAALQAELQSKRAPSNIYDRNLQEASDYYELYRAPALNIREQILRKTLSEINRYTLTRSFKNSSRRAAPKSLFIGLQKLATRGYLTQQEYDTLTAALSKSGGVEGLRDSVISTTKEVLDRFLSNPNNQLAIFESSFPLHLPTGFRFAPSRIKQSAANVVNSLANFTIVPQTRSAHRLQITAPHITVSNKSIATVLPLGQLIQGLPQKLWFGTLRYFWYSSRAHQEIKQLLAARFLKLFPRNDVPYIVYDTHGKLVDFEYPIVEGFPAQAAKGASASHIERSKVRGADNIAIRTWIQHKNIPGAASISGRFKYSYLF